MIIKIKEQCGELGQYDILVVDETSPLFEDYPWECEYKATPEQALELYLQQRHHAIDYGYDFEHDGEILVEITPAKQAQLDNLAKYNPKQYQAALMLLVKRETFSIKAVA